MFRKTKVCTSLMLAFGGSLGLASVGAMAQQQLERVEITGSAIKRIDAETAVPVTIIKADELKKEGVVSVEQMIQRLTGATSVTTTSQVVGSGTGGASYADLRGIGPEKTLILLNGRRIANNALQSSQPDLNMIPFAALDRVEVLRDGASALYGTDAIGGVINFITKKEYTEGEISLNATSPQSAGGKSTGVSGSIGFGGLETDRYNVMAVLNYQKTDRINSQKRSFGSRGVLPERGIDGSSPTTYPANYSQRQVNNPATGLPWLTVTDPDTGVVTHPARTFNANPTFPDCAPVGNGGSINTGASATNCRFDPTPFQDLTPETETASFFTRGAFKLNADTTISAEYFITRNAVRSIIGPVPEGGLSMTSASPFYPGNGITAGPTGFTLDPTLPVGINWRTADAGGRAQSNNNTSQRFLLNLEGLVAGWDYNVGASYNSNKLEDPLTGGYVNDSKIAAGVAGVDANGAAVPYLNPFGAQSAAGAAYLAAAGLRGNLQKAKGTVTSIDFKASRELGDWLGAGSPAAIALGAEFRREKFEDIINAEVASQAASTGVDPASSVTGSRKVWAVFGELNVPLVKNLDATLAIRHDHYSDFGSTTNPKVGLRFQPMPEVLARASYSTGFRAPSLYELYQPNYLTFTGGAYNDPLLCPGGTPRDATVDVASACNLQFLQQQGGNKNLQPEKAKNFTFGLVFEPIKDLSFGVDFWWIRIRNQINAFPEFAIFGDPAKYAGRFIRDANGTLDPNAADPGYVVAVNDNLGDTRTNGIDLSANYMYRLGGGNNITLGFTGTYINKFEYQREIGGEYIQNAGRFVDSGVIFRWKHSLTVTYNAPNWSIGLNNRLASGYDDENTQVDAAYFNRVGSYTLWDLFGSYSPTKSITIQAGIKNLFDTNPPFSNQGQTFQAGYDPRYTDPTGRAYYARLNYKFK